MNLTATLFAQVIAFGIMIWLVNRFLWGPFIAVLDARAKRISDGLSAAERGKNELRLAEDRAKEILRQAREEAGAIVDQANQRGVEIIESAKDNARVEAERVLVAMRAEFDRERSAAILKLRGEYLHVVEDGVRAILRREVNVKDHESLLTELIERL